MIEDTEREDDKLDVFTPVTVNQNIMKKGSDIKGAMVLKKGQVLGSSEIGRFLAALGLSLRLKFSKLH